MQFLRSFLNLPLRSVLACSALRRRVIFEITQRYYRELNVVVPLGQGLACPILSLEHWVSYMNVFPEAEYDEMLNLIPQPRNWLDLGCHAGHFTLLMVLRWAQRDLGVKWQALLVDPDSRVEAAISKLIECNKFAPGQVQFIHGAISAAGKDIAFAERDYMTSEVVSEISGISTLHRVSCVDEREIMARLPPPYDLLKVDIEGGEYDFLRAYRETLSHARHLLFEWHSWHPGGGGKGQLLSLAQEAGYRLIKESHSDRSTIHNGQPGQCGVILMENDRMVTNASSAR